MRPVVLDDKPIRCDAPTETFVERDRDAASLAPEQSHRRRVAEHALRRRQPPADAALRDIRPRRHAAKLPRRLALVIRHHVAHAADTRLAARGCDERTEMMRARIVIADETRLRPRPAAAQHGVSQRENLIEVGLPVGDQIGVHTACYDTDMRRVRTAWHTISGLVTLSDVLGTIGFWLYRGTLRRTMLFAIAMGGALLADRNDSLGISTKAAVGTASVVFAVSCFGGALLMFVGGSFSKAALKLGEAKGGNLLEDMKKCRQPMHRDRLWKHVFRYERDLHPPQAITAEEMTIERNRDALELLCNPANNRRITVQQRVELEAVIGSLGLTPCGWQIAFDHAMFLPLPRSILKHQMRYDLSNLKDWYDGAPFHNTDNKLQHHFDAFESIQEAKHDARLTRFFLLTHTRKRMLQSVWFKVISRAIQLRVARACRKLDQKYAPFHFSIDQFLWPNELTDEMLRRELGVEAFEDMVDLRTRIFQRVLTSEPQLAMRLMQRAIYPNFEAASQLRRLYDPAYVLGELRALRIAVHVDRDGLKTLLLGAQRGDRPWTLRLADRLAGRAPIKPKRAIADVIEQVIVEKDRYSTKLVAVRIHHELTRCELEDYEHYLHQIMGGGAAAAAAIAETVAVET